MSDEFKDVSTVPTLTLEPFQPEVEKQAVVKTEEPPMDETILTEEERKMVDEFAKQIDLTNSGLVLQYGAGTQKKMADFSESALENVKSKDLGEVGELLSGVVKELKSFDEEEEKGFFGIFKKASNKIESMKVKYARAETNVNEIVKVLESHQVQMLKDVALLDKMYELNLTYFKELSMYILAGKKKLDEARSTRLAELMAKAERTGLPEDAQAAKDFDAMCNRFEKKLHDLELTRMISIQTAPQIRLVQNNDTLMVEKIQSKTVNTIPLWKSQMVLALGVEHSTQAAEAQRRVTDVTNELLKKKHNPALLPIQIAYFAGLRIGEVCGLTWQDIDLKEQCLTIRRSMRYDSVRKKTQIGPTKRKKIRTVDFCDTLAAILREAKKEQMLNSIKYGPLYSQNYYRIVKEKNRTYYEVYSLPRTETPPEDYTQVSFVCLRPDGAYEAPATVSSVCRYSRKKIGDMDDFHFHLLRHTYTTNLLSHGAAPKDVQELLGHSDVSTTMNIYAHATREAKRTSARLLDKVVGTA